MTKKQAGTSQKRAAGRTGSSALGAPFPPTWIAPGRRVEVLGIPLNDGMVYVGTSDPASPLGTEPSLIDPALPLKGRNKASDFYFQMFTVSYRSLNPDDRRLYLAWLASGRRHPDAPLVYLSLFMMGLERRVFTPLPLDSTRYSELALIRQEVVGLAKAYSRRDPNLAEYLLAFTDFIELLMEGPIGLVDQKQNAELRSPEYGVPYEVEIGLGLLATDKQPIPADWAFKWAWYLPDIRIRPSAAAALDELRSLFAVRYRKQFGEGMVLYPGKKRLTPIFLPANSTISEVEVDIGDVADVFMRPRPVRQLTELMTSVMDELDPYSRWLALNRDKGGTIAALGHLPDLLLGEPHAAMDRLRAWIEQHLKNERVALIDPEEILNLWDIPGKLSRAESQAVAKVLQRCGVGIEPDIRYGGQPISSGKPVAIYRPAKRIVEIPSDDYAAATTIAYLGLVVLKAEGVPSPASIVELAKIVGQKGPLPQSEVERLYVYLWASASGESRLAGLTSRIQNLTEDDRAFTANLLIAEATIDGAVSPSTVKAVTRIYGMLGLDQSTVTSRLHAALTGAPYRHVDASGHVTLDRSAIDAKVRETSVVSDLLGDIFADHEESHEVPAEIAPEEEPVAGLDPAHAALLRQLATRESWDASAFEALATSFRLMPNGALDVLNEAAFEAVDEPLIEGDDPLVINRDAMDAMLLPLT
ncbi:MAG: TerB N-terminal domain-containing protein [Thermomicrobiales bacterium]